MRTIFYILLFLFSLVGFSQNTIIIAHRGASAYAPENTLASFEKAIEMGALIIETDVHQTKDSVVVIMHDLSVDRTTNGKGLIKDLSYNDFKQLYIKQKQFPVSSSTSSSLTSSAVDKKKNIHISVSSSAVENQKGIKFPVSSSGVENHPPTLEEVIIAINGRCKLLIELKKGNPYYPNIEKHIVELIRKYNAEKWITTIHSFEKEPLLTIAKLDSNIIIQKLIVLKFLFTKLNFSKDIQKDDFKTWDGVNIHYRFCTKRFVKKIHQLKKTVYVWTVNNPRKAKKYIKRGVDGIITNYPDILKLK